MCGIAGFVGNGDLQILQRMTDALVHRGPDAGGYWSDPGSGVYLGHRRLSIVDHSGGAQPMWTQDNQIGIVFNGEIYNHKELRIYLQGQGFNFLSDHSDTEVLLHGFRYWGRALPEKLNGMWAFTIYDRPAKAIFCSRDRFGKKPFFYTQQSNTFIFASELKSFDYHPDVRKELSVLSLKKYFAYGYTPAPLTIFNNIFKLEAGHSIWLDLDTRSLRKTKYWDFKIEPVSGEGQRFESQLAERLRDELSKAVKRRLVADVPVGIFLSGGVDSSAISSLAVKQLSAGEALSFSIGFDDSSFDESIYADQVARHLGTKHFHKKLDLRTAERLAEEIGHRLDEPLGDSSIIPTYLLCGYAREHVTVALGGDGADELFAGYDPFRALKWASMYQHAIPSPIHRGISMLAARLPVSHHYMSLDFKLKRTLRGLSHPPSLWLPVWMASLDGSQLDELFQEHTPLEEVFSEAISLWEEDDSKDMVDRTLTFYTKLYLQDDILVKLDRASMMHSLEARCPFLDIEFVDFVRTIPSSYKLRNGVTKYILKKSLEPLLPNNILYRRKQGFGVPIGKWFKDGNLIAPTQAIAGIADCRFRDEQRRNHTDGREDNRAFLWNDYILSSVLSSSYNGRILGNPA